MNKHEYPALNEIIYTHTLSNGLELIMVPKNDYHQVCAYLTTRFGGAYHGLEIKGQKMLSGLAHFLEHRLFDNPKGEVMELYNGLGATYTNAYTGNDITTFIFKSSKNIDKCLNLLLDFVQKAEFKTERVENEKKIIVQEYYLYEDNPNSKLYYGLIGNALVKHPYKMKVIGTVEDINATTREQLYLAHDSYYVPKNMYLTVIGNFDPKKLIKLVEKNQASKTFEDVKLTQFSSEEPFKVAKEYEEISIGLPFYKVGVAYKFKGKSYKSEEERIKEEKIYNMIYALLFAPTSSLAEELLRKGIVRGFVDAEDTREENLSLSLLVAETNDKDVFLNELDKIIKNAPSYLKEDEFNKLKKAAYAGAVKGLDSLDGYADEIVRAYKNKVLYPDVFKIDESITFEDVKEAAKKLGENVKSVYVIH